MGCGCGDSGNIDNSIQITHIQHVTVSNEPCDITNDILETWKKILTCIRERTKQQEIGISDIAINQLLGVIQSALNYPDNYCYYKTQLQFLKDNIIPRIITNVPDCIN